jgi:hypothetical protein
MSRRWLPNITFDRTADSQLLAAAGQRGVRRTAAGTAGGVRVAHNGMGRSTRGGSEALNP